jgi:hypothetical protein
VNRSTCRFLIALLVSCAPLVAIVSPLAADAPANLAAPRIDSVVISVPQPQSASPAVIWFDDFDGEPLAYTESEGPNVDNEAFMLAA